MGTFTAGRCGLAANRFVGNEPQDMARGPGEGRAEKKPAVDGPPRAPFVSKEYSHDGVRALQPASRELDRCASAQAVVAAARCDGGRAREQAQARSAAVPQPVSHLIEKRRRSSNRAM